MQVAEEVVTLLRTLYWPFHLAPATDRCTGCWAARQRSPACWRGTEGASWCGCMGRPSTAAWFHRGAESPGPRRPAASSCGSFWPPRLLQQLCCSAHGTGPKRLLCLCCLLVSVYDYGDMQVRSRLFWSKCQSHQGSRTTRQPHVFT